MPTEIIVIAIVISVFCTFAGALYWGDLQTRGSARRPNVACGDDLPAATSHSALSALRGRDAGQQVEQGESAVRHFCLSEVRNDGHFRTSARGLEARAVGRLGRRAILLHKPTCRRRTFAEPMRLLSDYLASVLI